MSYSSKCFYKSMNGDFSRKLLIPPPILSQFDRKFPKEVLLCYGPTRLWRVLVVKYDQGRLYFKTGWSDFVHDNEVEAEDLLVFRYVGKSRFEVDIFGTSGCLKQINVNRVRSRRCHMDINSDEDCVLKCGTSKAAEYLKKENFASKEKRERSASSPKARKNGIDRGVKGPDTVKMAFGTEANIKKQGFVDKSSGSRKRKVSFEAPMKVKKQKSSDYEPFFKEVPEAKFPEADVYICSDDDAGPTLKPGTINAADKIKKGKFEPSANDAGGEASKHGISKEAEHVTHENSASKENVEPTASSPKARKSGLDGSVKGSDTRNDMASANKANIKKQGFVDEFSGLHKGKVSFEDAKNVTKEKDSDNERFVSSTKASLEEVPAYIYSDGPMSKRWISKAAGHVNKGNVCLKVMHERSILSPKASRDKEVRDSDSGTVDMGFNNEDTDSKHIVEEQKAETVKEGKRAKEEKPTSDEVYAAVVDILMEEEDICSIKDALSFVLRKLAKHFGVNLRHRKAEVKSIIDSFIMDNSDTESELKKSPNVDDKEVHQPRSSHCDSDSDSDSD